MMGKISGKFWMVYGIDCGAPTARHGSKEIAETEAKRLARNNPGTTFVVLEAVTAIIKRDLDVITLRERGSSDASAALADDDIPF